MPLSNLVFTASGAPNLAGPALQVIQNRPNPYEAFSKGYDDQQKRELQLQQYREAKLKADLATALYPDLVASQQAMLRARLAGINSPNIYQSAGSGVGPIDTAVKTAATTPAAAPVTADVAALAAATPYNYQTLGTKSVPLQVQPTGQLPGMPDTGLGNPLGSTVGQLSQNPFM